MQGEGTSALSTLVAGMHGPSFEDDTACSTCGESKASKICSACNYVSNTPCNYLSNTPCNYVSNTPCNYLSNTPCNYLSNTPCNYVSNTPCNYLSNTWRIQGQQDQECRSFGSLALYK